MAVFYLFKYYQYLTDLTKLFRCDNMMINRGDL